MLRAQISPLLRGRSACPPDHLRFRIHRATTGTQGADPRSTKKRQLAMLTHPGPHKRGPYQLHPTIWYGTDNLSRIFYVFVFDRLGRQGSKFCHSAQPPSPGPSSRSYAPIRSYSRRNSGFRVGSSGAFGLLAGPPGDRDVSGGAPSVPPARAQDPARGPASCPP